MKRLISFFLLVILSACGRNNESNNPAPAPVISSFSPASGTVGTTVTITGSDFSATPANNVVKFNGTTANVTAATTTSLTVTVPAGASTGKITVQVNNQTATSATDFTLTSITAVGYKNNTLGGILYNYNQDAFTNFTSTNLEAKVFKKGNDIYISAMQNTSTSLKTIGYYKNGIFTEVGTGYAVKSIYVDASNNVYMCGTNDKNYPCYWKNTQMTTLASKQGKATDMEIVGSDIYVSGTYFFNNTTYIIASWKNGVESTYGSLNLYNNQVLPNTLIEIDGSDVYVHGSLATGPKIWKNGKDTGLTFGLATEAFKAISGVFYYAGRSFDGSNQVASVGFGSNGGAFSKISTSASIVNDFKIKGTDIYYCGVESNKATIWKNNTILKKSNTDNTYFTDIWVE